MKSLLSIFISLTFLCVLIALFYWKSMKLDEDSALVKRVIGWGAGAFLFICLSVLCVISKDEFYQTTYPASAEATILSVEEKTTRTVTIVNKVPIINRNTRYEVQYSFVAEDGITYGGKDIIYSKPNGDRIIIQYDPESPTENAIP